MIPSIPVSSYYLKRNKADIHFGRKATHQERAIIKGVLADREVAEGKLSRLDPDLVFVQDLNFDPKSLRGKIRQFGHAMEYGRIEKRMKNRTARHSYPWALVRTILKPSDMSLFFMDDQNAKLQGIHRALEEDGKEIPCDCIHLTPFPNEVWTFFFKPGSLSRQDRRYLNAQWRQSPVLVWNAQAATPSALGSNRHLPHNHQLVLAWDADNDEVQGTKPVSRKLNTSG